MFLAVDIGNSHVVMGLYNNKEKLFSFRLETRLSRTEDEYTLQISEILHLYNYTIRDIEAVGICSVVPSITKVFATISERHIGVAPMIINHEYPLDIEILIDNPSEAGADRLVNSISGFATYGAPLIVVDLGTGTTFDCVDACGNYIGGVILPGIGISMNALFARASKLTNVPWEMPSRVLGKTTSESLQSGLFYGFASQIDGLVALLKKEMGEETKVVLTGGLANVIGEACTCVDDINIDLTLNGLHLLWQRAEGK